METHPIWKDYIQLNKLGSSTFGTVYKAKSKKDNKIVSIKEYSKSQKDDVSIVYKNEMKYLDELKSDNIINYIKTEETKTNYYIIRNYHNITLEEFIKIHPKGISSKEIKKILLDLSKAFKILNEKKVVHRNIKPSNILLSFKGINIYKVILSGINLTKKCEEQEISKLRGERFICPPEILKGENIDMKDDIWSVGILIYYMIEGKYPFEGKKDITILKNIEKGIQLNCDDNSLKDLFQKTLIKRSERISWKDFFEHEFLKNDNVEEIRRNLIEKKSKFEEKIRNYKNEIQLYSAMIKKYKEELFKRFDTNIKDKLFEVSSYFDKIYNSNLLE